MDINLKEIKDNSLSIIEVAKENLDENTLVCQIISELNPTLFVIPDTLYEILKKNNQWNYNVVNDVEEQEDFIKETLTRRLNDFGGEVIVFMYFTEPFNNEFKESSDLPILKRTYSKGQNQYKFIGDFL